MYRFIINKKKERNKNIKTSLNPNIINRGHNLFDPFIFKIFQQQNCIIDEHKNKLFCQKLKYIAKVSPPP